MIQQIITLVGKELCLCQHYTRHLARGMAESPRAESVTSSVGRVKITPVILHMTSQILFSVCVCVYVCVCVCVCVYVCVCVCVCARVHV